MTGIDKRRQYEKKQRERGYQIALEEFRRRGGCAQCGYRGLYCHYEWDHREPLRGRDKPRVSRYVTRATAFRREVAKCDLLCRFCHAEKTAREALFPRALAFEPLTC